MSHDDFAFEPVEGLPEAPPAGEEILWQGKPDWRRMAVEVFGLKWVAGYFVILFGWRTMSGAATLPLLDSAIAASFFLVLGLAACGFLALVAWMQAATTVYTVTSRRVAMRIGAALTLTLNLPYRHILNAGVRHAKDGSGTIALEMTGDGDTLGYMMTWPHVRPWHVRNVQPALRCIPEVDAVAAILAEAAEAEISTPRVARQTAPAALAAE